MEYSDVKIPYNIRKMSRIDGIHITVTNYIYRPGITNLKKQMSNEQYKDFMIYIAAEMVAILVTAIDNQRYEKTWKPLSISYRTWKEKHHLSLNIWEATGQMKKSIKCFKKGNYIEIGFRNKDIYPKSKAPLNLIAKFLEYGSVNVVDRPPSRPLWRPLVIYMRKNISRYYKNYQKELKRKKRDFLYSKKK